MLLPQGESVVGMLLTGTTSQQPLMKIKQEELPSFSSSFAVTLKCPLLAEYLGAFINTEVWFVVSAPASQTEYRRVDLELRYYNLITDISGKIQQEEKRKTINNQYQECKRKHYYRCYKYEKKIF